MLGDISLDWLLLRPLQSRPVSRLPFRGRCLRTYVAPGGARKLIFDLSLPTARAVGHPSADGPPARRAFGATSELKLARMGRCPSADGLLHGAFAGRGGWASRNVASTTSFANPHAHARCPVEEIGNDWPKGKRVAACRT